MIDNRGGVTLTRAVIWGVLLILASPWGAYAACSTSYPGGGPIVYTIKGFTPDTINPNVAVGQVLFEKETSMVTDRPHTFTCPGGAGLTHYRGVGVQGPYNTYLTNVQGVGMRFRFSDPGALQNHGPITDDADSTETTHVNVTMKVQVEFVKVGDMTTGGSVVGEVAGGFVQNNAVQTLSVVFDAPILITPARPTCAVVASDLKVSLGDVATSVFTGMGSVSPLRPFAIDLDCSGGGEGENTTVYITLTDLTDQGNTSDTLSLRSDSTASGVGIQIINNDTPVNLGPASDVIGNINQWMVGTTGNGPFSIPLAARYVQTVATITPGSANGAAIFTMGYN